jgi:signal transduction histidine kinase
LKQRSATRLAWISLAVVLLVTLGGQALALSRGESLDLFELFMLSFPVVGALIASRQPENAIGWLMLGIGWGAAFASALSIYAVYALEINPGSLPRPDIAVALNQGSWVPFIGIVGTFLLLLFPDGHLPTPRWRTWAWFSGVAMALAYIIITIGPGKLEEYPHLRNPLGIEALRPFIGAAFSLVALIPVSIVGCAVALTRRYRRSRGQERLQMKWFTATAALLAVSYLILMALNLPFLVSGTPTPHWINVIGNIGVFPFVLLPFAVGIAILKHRLYDIDVVINKTVVFGTLAAFITAVYVAIVVGIGALIGSGNKPNLGLSILATAIVAVAFQPVRERVQHFANRLVYGKRATPYEVLAEFSGKVAETYATEDVLPRMARTVAEGTGAAHAEVWLRSGSELRAAGSWPEDGAADSKSHVALDGQLPDFDGVDHAIAVRHQGELLGALTVTKPAGEPLTPAEEGLLADLASQAGLVLRNVGLSAELLARLDELKASRQRLVAAQDQERRRLERDLHDGAQQHLVALKTRLALAERLTERDPGKAEQLIANLEQEADDALDTLRDLARGIYPPLLADQGLLVALQAQADKAPIAVDIHGDGVTRYPQEIEAAVYFCCLEALQNVAKYANATRARVSIEPSDGEVAFSVTDDGIGFDPNATPHGSGTQNMADRVEILGGNLHLDSSPGQGTTVVGRIPVELLEPVG